jgi:hypothetical protein
MYSSYSFTTSALYGGEWSASRPGCALPPGKGPPVPAGQEAELRSRSGHRGYRNNPGIEHRSPDRPVHIEGTRRCLWTAATNEPIAHSRDYMWAWRTTVEWYWQGKPEELREEPVLVQLCPLQIRNGLDWPGLRGERPETNRLSHGTPRCTWLHLHLVLVSLTKQTCEATSYRSFLTILTYVSRLMQQ